MSWFSLCDIEFSYGMIMTSLLYHQFFIPLSVGGHALQWVVSKCSIFSLSTGLREWFAQSDERNAPPRIPVMVNMFSTSVTSKKSQKTNDISVNSTSLDQNAANRNSVLMDEYSDDDEDFQIAEPDQDVLFAFPHL